MTVHDDRSLLALQGPAAVETLAPLVDIDLSKVYFSDFHKLDIAGIPCYLTRTGCATSFTTVLSHGPRCSVLSSALTEWAALMLISEIQDVVEHVQHWALHFQSHPC